MDHVGNCNELEMERMGEVVKRQRGRRRTSSNRNNNARNQTRIALILSVCSICLLTIVALVCAILSDKITRSSQGRWWNRLLDDEDNNNNDEEQQQSYVVDYRSRPCEAFYEVDYEDRCLFARTCNAGKGLVPSIVFCRTDVLSTYQWCLVLGPFLLIWLVTLFRMLGTTAEDFFSPSLEMFSVKLGLPPRFAGVSLLALGNGAADVSATINAIVLNPTTGYRMSLGALTGASMFVGTVVAGVVIVIAEGVPCRGALVRDVATLAIVVGVVYAFLSTGKIGPAAVSTFVTMYIVFVSIVLVADIYHRAVVLPRLRKERHHRRLEEARRIQEAAEKAFRDPHSPAQHNDDDDRRHGSVEMSLEQLRRGPSLRILTNTDDTPAGEEIHPIRSRALSAVLMALSNYDRYDNASAAGTSDDYSVSINNNSASTSNCTWNDSVSSRISTGTGGWGLGTTSSETDRPFVLHGVNGILSTPHPHQSPASFDLGDGSSSPHKQQQQQLPQLNGTTTVGISPQSPEAPYSPMPDDLPPPPPNMCVDQGFAAPTWVDAWKAGGTELRCHWREFWNDLWNNEENSMLDKFLMLIELPFTIMRKITVAIPCDGYYCRGLVALSLALSSIWIGLYIRIQHRKNVFLLCPYWYLCGCIILFTLGAITLRYAPGDGDGTMPLKISVPIAFWGFMVAATWIDAIADQLVALLSFFGVIFRIPTPIMGLTVLAWGNSMGDLSANMTMARKGLANMAITACFAGPVFNILIGLGAGFSALAGKTGHAEAYVSLTPPLSVGFLFILLNCLLVLVTGTLWTPGMIPSEYGYAALTLYALYVVVSIVFQFAL